MSRGSASGLDFHLISNMGSSDWFILWLNMYCVLAHLYTLLDSGYTFILCTSGLTISSPLENHATFCRMDHFSQESPMDKCRPRRGFYRR